MNTIILQQYGGSSFTACLQLSCSLVPAHMHACMCMHCRMREGYVHDCMHECRKLLILLWSYYKANILNELFKENIKIIDPQHKCAHYTHTVQTYTLLYFFLIHKIHTCNMHTHISQLLLEDLCACV